VGERLNGAIDFDVVADVASRNSIEFVG
jgi:hypothetical protein